MDLQKFMKLVLRIGLNLLMGQVAQAQLMRNPTSSMATHNYEQWLKVSSETISDVRIAIDNWTET